MNEQLRRNCVELWKKPGARAEWKRAQMMYVLCDEVYGGPGSMSGPKSGAVTIQVNPHRCSSDVNNNELPLEKGHSECGVTSRSSNPQ
ncbi:hypothetical protein Aduo_009867 [Ancylostoma duodenale]